MNTWSDFDKPPDPWEAPAVPFDRQHPEKTIPFAWAVELLQDMHKANPASFGAKLAKVVQRWSAAQYAKGGDGEDGQQ